jgi:hypothetical protein
MSCISPIAPALDVMGCPFNIVRPPLSLRMTARIQSCGIAKRWAASAM